MSMKKISALFGLFSILFLGACSAQTSENKTDSKIQYSAAFKYVKDIPVPEGYMRTDAKTGSYADFLRNLELKTENNTVYLYDGTEKWNQSAQFAVLKTDVGTRDLQQCADAVMRLRGEFLFQQKKYAEIHFNFLSDGKPRYFTEYAKGDFSHKKFRSYMDYIFAYANTGSLHNELKRVENVQDIQIGDVFIQKRQPYGHAVTVMDIARNAAGETIFMLSQSYMPAQEIHILKNPENETLSPWYSLKTTELETPEWTFAWSDLRRF